jgi:hypothetical protein
MTSAPVDSHDRDIVARVSAIAVRCVLENDVEGLKWG